MYEQKRASTLVMSMRVRHLKIPVKILQSSECHKISSESMKMIQLHIEVS